MTKVNYTGLSNPAEAFEQLRPAYHAVIQMKIKCRPFGPDYLVLLKITDAMNEAARHFMPKETSVVSFFGSKPTG